MKKVWLGLTVLGIMFSVNGGEAFAQRKGAQCTAGWKAACIERCSKSGGQVRLCPGYCDKRQREQGC